MRILLNILILTGIISTVVPAQTSTDNKLDTILQYQKTMYKEQKNSPLENKSYGVEINPFRLLLMSKGFSLSGGFALFNVTRVAEINFPLLYSKPEDDKSYREFDAACHFRYFLGNTQNGFYLSAFTQYTLLTGYDRKDWITTLFDTTTNLGPRNTSNRWGLGFGLGFRKFSYKGLYWGSSLNFGRYLLKDNKRFYGEFLDLISNDVDYIIDFEFLKFGWAF